MIEETLRIQINIAIMQQLHSSTHLKWRRMKEGFTNDKYLICDEKDNPVAVCKIYSNNEIYNAGLRLEREKQALEMFGGSFAPKLIWSSKYHILVYEYLKGKRIDKIENPAKYKDLLFDTIDSVHKIAKEKRKTKIEDITQNYKRILRNCLESRYEFPTKLTEKLRENISKIETISRDFKDELTLVHGDLVPANIIVKDGKISFIDWEFFRAELTFFDFGYFNFYSKFHNIPVNFENHELKDVGFYSEFIKLLDDIYWVEYNYRKAN